MKVDKLAPAGVDLPSRVIGTDGRLGWADARNLGLRHSAGEITVILDTSLEPTGDIVTPLLAAFDEEGHVRHE